MRVTRLAKEHPENMSLLVFSMSLTDVCSIFARDYGVMVELLPNTPSVLLHVSEMAHMKVRNTLSCWLLNE